MSNIYSFEADGVSFSYDAEARNTLSLAVFEKANDGELVYDANSKSPTEIVGIPANKLIKIPVVEKELVEEKEDSYVGEDDAFHRAIVICRREEVKPDGDGPVYDRKEVATIYYQGKAEGLHIIVNGDNLTDDFSNYGYYIENIDEFNYDGAFETKASHQGVIFEFKSCEFSDDVNDANITIEVSADDWGPFPPSSDGEQYEVGRITETYHHTAAK